MVIDKFGFISAIFGLKNNNMEETIGNDHNLMLISIFSSVYSCIHDVLNAVSNPNPRPRLETLCAISMPITFI